MVTFEKDKLDRDEVFLARECVAERIIRLQATKRTSPCYAEALDAQIHQLRALLRKLVLPSTTHGESIPAFDTAGRPITKRPPVVLDDAERRMFIDD